MNLAEIAYNAYRASYPANRGLPTGAQWPPFECLNDETRRMWAAVAAAVVQSMFAATRQPMLDAGHQLATATAEILETYLGTSSPCAESLAEWSADDPAAYAATQERMATHAAVLDAVAAIDALFIAAEQAANEKKIFW